MRTRSMLLAGLAALACAHATTLQQLSLDDMIRESTGIVRAKVTGASTGLRGQSIPIGARILAAVDALDALASHRQYRRAFPLDEAMAKVASDSGKAFDPEVVEVLQRRYVDLEALASAQDAETAQHCPAVSLERGQESAPGLDIARRPASEPSEKLQLALAL